MFIWIPCILTALLKRNFLYLVKTQLQKGLRTVLRKQLGLIIKQQNITSAGKDVEKLEASCTAGETQMGDGAAAMEQPAGSPKG